MYLRCTRATIRETRDRSVQHPVPGPAEAIGLHRVEIAAIDGTRVLVRDLEALGNTHCGREAGAHRRAVNARPRKRGCPAWHGLRRLSHRGTQPCHALLRPVTRESGARIHSRRCAFLGVNARRNGDPGGIRWLNERRRRDPRHVRGVRPPPRSHWIEDAANPTRTIGSYLERFPRISNGSPRIERWCARRDT